MSSINVLIIEDRKEESDALVEVLTANNYAIAGVATSFKEALTLFYAAPVDVVIIDVFLSGKPEGITFAETINIPPNVPKPFVFLTSSKDRQIFERARLTRPFGFLLKPFNELEVLYAIEMALEKFYTQPMALTGDEQSVLSNSEFLFIKKKKSLVKVYISEISHIEVEERYCNIYTTSGKFVILISLVKIAAMLEPHGFIRTHRNYLVNSKLIKEINLQDEYVLLSGEISVPLSETYKKLTKDIRILS